MNEQFEYQNYKHLPTILMSTDLSKGVWDLGSIDVSARGIGSFLRVLELEPQEISETTIHVLPANPETDEIASRYIGEGYIELEIPRMTAWVENKHIICRSLARSLGYRAFDSPFGKLEQEQKDFRARSTGGRIYKYLGNALLGITSVVAAGEAISPVDGYLSAGVIGLGAASLYMLRRQESKAIKEFDNPVARAIHIAEGHAMEDGISTGWLHVQSRACL